MIDYADRHIIGIEWFWQTVKTSAVCATKTITASNLKSFLFVFLEYTTNAFYNNFFCKIGFSLFIEYIAIKKKYVLRYGTHQYTHTTVCQRLLFYKENTKCGEKYRHWHHKHIRKGRIKQIQQYIEMVMCCNCSHKKTGSAY